MAERVEATLAELRALLGRVQQRRLEAGDWAVVNALVSEEIDQAEPGQEWLIIGPSEDDEDSGGKTDRALSAERSRPETSRR